MNNWLSKLTAITLPGLGSKRLVYVIAGVFAAGWLRLLWVHDKMPEMSWQQIVYQLGILAILVGLTARSE